MTLYNGNIYFNLLFKLINLKKKSCYYYSDIFNYEKPTSMNNKYFDENEEGISCPCLPECTRIDYGTEIRPSLVS